MAGIFDKISTLIGSNIHALLDAAIDLDSVGACKEQVRKIEDESNNLKRHAAAARADVGMAQAAVDGTKHRIDENTANAQMLLSDDDPSNDNVATTLMEEVVTLQETLAEQEQALADAKKVADGMAEASNKLSAKKTELIRNINRLENMQRTSNAKKNAADALTQVAALSNGAGAVSVDDIAARMKREGAVQDERLNEALASTSGGSSADAVRAAKAKALIEQMKKKAGGAPA